MLFAIDRTRRDSALFQFSTKPLREFIDPNHILLKIDKAFNFERIVKPLEKYYCEDNGRAAIHPEIIVRALLLASLYQIPSFRALVSRISENLAFRYFLFLGLNDEVFDHSTISVFIERIGSEGFRRILISLNEELVSLSLISEKVYLDSTLLKANLSSDSLEKTDKTPEEFAAQAERENDLFVIKEVEVKGESLPTIKKRYYQDAQGRLPISPVDTDARWAKRGKGKATLSYKADLAACDEGFILSAQASHSNSSDSKAGEVLLEEMPISPVSITADSAFSTSSIREFLAKRKIDAFIPLNPRQKASCLSARPFKKWGDKLICREGKELSFSHINKKTGSSVFVAKISDCSNCPNRCFSGKGSRKSVHLSPTIFSLKK